SLLPHTIRLLSLLCPPPPTLLSSSLSLTMPPRPHGACTKRSRNDVSSSSYDGHLFPSRAHLAHFSLFVELPLDSGHLFDNEVLEFFDLTSIPGIQLNRIFNMMRCPTSVNEHAMKLFYCNLTDHKDEYGWLGIQLRLGDEVRSRIWTYVYG